MSKVESAFHQMQGAYLLLDILHAEARGDWQAAEEIRRDVRALDQESNVPKRARPLDVY
jgi:hypothetical protein